MHAGRTSARCVYALRSAESVWCKQVQLDGSVRASGAGMPPWERWKDDLPELDSLQTRLTDGVGTSM
jgi:hypothetical protein